jgi:pimeloyl-ACP methyl ester carboxylesterase
MDNSEKSLHFMPIFVLIHGTFSRKAKWTERGSKLYEELRKAFPVSKIEVFDWDAKNSHKSRIRAARDLETLVDKLSESFPRGKIFLVAHSHGGNIALYASRHFDCRSKLAGIVCMGTPFVIPSLRLMNPAYILMGPLAGIFGAVGFMLAISIIGDSSLPFRPVLLCVISAMSLMGVVFLRVFQGNWMNGANAEASKIMEQLDLSRLREPPILSVHSLGDEAFRLISIAKVLHQVFANLYYRVEQPLTRVILYFASKRPEKLLKIACIGLLGAFPLFIFPTVLGMVIMAPISMLLASAFCCLGMWAVFVGIVIVGYPLVCFFLRTLGPEFIWYGLFVSLQIDLEPWKLKHSQLAVSENDIQEDTFSRLVIAERTSKDSFGELIHTRIYKDPYVVETVIHWIDEVFSNGIP